MELDFNPDEIIGKTEVAQGVYSFSIDAIEQRKFSSGTKGCTVTFDVFLEDRAIKAYENMYYTPKALWKIKDLCKAVGTAWPEKGNKLDTSKLIGKSGKAFFGRPKGEKYLKVIDFIDPHRKNQEIPKQGTPPAVSEEDVPF